LTGILCLLPFRVHNKISTEKSRYTENFSWKPVKRRTTTQKCRTSWGNNRTNSENNMKSLLPNLHRHKVGLSTGHLTFIHRQVQGNCRLKHSLHQFNRPSPIGPIRRKHASLKRNLTKNKLTRNLYQDNVCVSCSQFIAMHINIYGWILVTPCGPLRNKEKHNGLIINASMLSSTERTRSYGYQLEIRGRA